MFICFLIIYFGFLNIFLGCLHIIIFFKPTFYSITPIFLGIHKIFLSITLISLLILQKISPNFSSVQQFINQILCKMPKNPDKVPFDIQRTIRIRLKETHLPVSSLAKDIHLTPTSLHQQLYRNSLQVNRLWSICKALKWNLFQEIANHLEKEIQSIQAKQKGIEIKDIHKEMDELKRKLELLENENKTLKEVITLLKS